MKIKLKIGTLISIALLIIMLVSGCTQGTVNESEETQTAERTITDLAGNSVTLPSADQLERVVIIAKPLLSTYISNIKDTSGVVGVHPMALSEINEDIIDIVVPNNKEISTTFLTGSESNTEELLKLDPDIILVYGDSQKKGLESIGIPIVDFNIKNKINEDWSVQVDELMREIYELDSNDSLQVEWDKANANIADIITEADNSEKQTGLMIMSNTGDKITVRGAGTFGDDWLLKSGLTNVASELSGENIEVTMEQILAWDPDIIYAFRGLPADQYLTNTISGQDWSQTKANQEGKIYNTPIGIMNWGAPCADSPLMIQWLVSKNFPDQLNDEEFIVILKDFYNRRYDITLTNELIQSTLYPYSGN
jgi:iron complex transport system substrate-binding protein